MPSTDAAVGGAINAESMALVTRGPALGPAPTRRAASGAHSIRVLLAVIWFAYCGCSLLRCTTWNLATNLELDSKNT